MRIQYFFKQWPESVTPGYFAQELAKIKAEQHWKLEVAYGHGDSGYLWMLVSVYKPECTECSFSAQQPDDVAIHLVDRHSWDAEKARLWLRDRVEETAFEEPI